MSVEECEDICVNYNGCEWYSWRHGGDPNNPVEAFCMLFEANGYTQTDKNYITNKKGSCISALTEFPTQSTSNPFTTSTKPPTNPTEEPTTEEPPTEEPPTEDPPTEEPPTEEPPTEEPPTEEPPTDEPTTEEPPTVEPPTEEPPTEPTSQPPHDTLSRVFIATGKTSLLSESDFLTSTEIIDLRDENVQCDGWTHIQTPLCFANAGFLEGKYVICGGDKPGNVHSNECYTMDNYAPTFTLFGSMLSNRTNAASMITPYSHSLWITGGHDENWPYLSSSELISSWDDQSMRTEEGPDLPRGYGRDSHAIVSINETSSLLIGGAQIWMAAGQLQTEVKDETSYFSHETDKFQFNEGPKLIQARIAHTAGLIIDKFTRETIVIVVGGNKKRYQTTEDTELNTTELLIEGSWVPGENLYFIS